MNPDLKNHKSHVEYSALLMDAPCPKNYETWLIGLPFEAIANTSAFKGEDEEFVFSNGDPTGCEYNGDLFGNGIRSSCWRPGTTASTLQVI